jgi:hypothetical protein
MLKIYLNTLIFLCVYPSNAYAYLDPGTGSYIFQIILAFILAALFSLKKYWKKFCRFLDKNIFIKRNNHANKE